jgi:hypothetical protein
MFFKHILQSSMQGQKNYWQIIVLPSSTIPARNEQGLMVQSGKLGVVIILVAEGEKKRGWQG